MKKRLILVVVLALLVTMVAVMPAFAHSAAPCNDTDGDGQPSGHEFAAHHIVPLAQEGMLGAGGHVPGSHHGFSLCNPSGK